MAWPALTAEDTLSGKGAKTNAQKMFERQVAATGKKTTWYFAETNMTTSLLTKDTQRIRVPSYAISGTVITLQVRAKTTSTGAATFQLNETDTTTNGSPTSPTLSSSYVYYPVTLTVPDNTWLGTLKTFEIQAQRPAAGVDNDWLVSGEFVMGNLQFQAP